MARPLNESAPSKTKKYPCRTYAARKARGVAPIHVGLDRQERADLDALIALEEVPRDRTRSHVIGSLLRAEATRRRVEIEKSLDEKPSESAHLREVKK